MPDSFVARTGDFLCVSTHFFRELRTVLLAAFGEEVHCMFQERLGLIDECQRPVEREECLLRLKLERAWTTECGEDGADRSTWKTFRNT